MRIRAFDITQKRESRNGCYNHIVVMFRHSWHVKRKKENAEVKSRRSEKKNNENMTRIDNLSIR